MAIANKTVNTKLKQSTKGGAKSKTPHFPIAQVSGVTAAHAKKLHEDIETLAVAQDDVNTSRVRKALFDWMRFLFFSQGLTSAYVDMTGGRQLLLKVNTRLWSLTDEQASTVEITMEDAGYDAGDFYHQSHSAKIDADGVCERVGDKSYSKFQADLAALMMQYGSSDLLEFKICVAPKPDFMTSRRALPPSLNMKLEGIKPTSLSATAKRMCDGGSSLG